MKYRQFVGAGLVGLVLFSSAFAAGDVLLTMNDLPFQPVNGLIHPSGVQFGFTIGGISSLDANYGAGGPGSTVFVQDPSIEGDAAGVLSIIFPTPTPIIGFGVARNSLSAIPSGAEVQLFNAVNASLGVTNLPLTPMPGFAEGQFNYTGQAAKRMTVSFPSSTGSTRFAFDNLLFRVPEPATAQFVIIAGIFVAASSLRRSVRVNASE